MSDLDRPNTDDEVLDLYRSMSTDELVTLRAALTLDRRAARERIEHELMTVHFTTGRLGLLARVLKERDV